MVKKSKVSGGSKHPASLKPSEWLDNTGDPLETKQDVEDLERLIEEKKERLKKRKAAADKRAWDKPRKALIVLMPTYKPKKPTKPN